MVDVMKKVPVREQNPEVRAKNFEEVCLGYNEEEAIAEASRCLNCKNAMCVKGCPVNINIPGFIKEVEEGNVEGAYQVISQFSALPAVCGRGAFGTTLVSGGQYHQAHLRGHADSGQFPVDDNQHLGEQCDRCRPERAGVAAHPTHYDRIGRHHVALCRGTVAVSPSLAVALYQ